MAILAAHRSSHPGFAIDSLCICNLFVESIANFGGGGGVSYDRDVYDFVISWFHNWWQNFGIEAFVQNTIWAVADIRKICQAVNRIQFSKDIPASYIVAIMKAFDYLDVCGA